MRQVCARVTVAAAVGLLALPAAADQVSIGASHDNTLFEASDGAYSSGAGVFFFVGKTNSSAVLRRGLLRFDVGAAVPAGSTITSVTLRLHMSQTTAGAQTINLHRALSSWGEGSSSSSGGAGADSTPGDATWIHRFWPGILWTTPGGDRAAALSAGRSVSGDNFYTWGSSAQMVSDVQGWLSTPAQNFGWVLIGNESANHTAKRFDTREHGTAANRPVLTITYTPPVPPCRPDWNQNGTLEPSDVAAFVTDWSTSLSQGTLTGDYDGNGVVNPADVAALVVAWFTALTTGC